MKWLPLHCLLLALLSTNSLVNAQSDDPLIGALISKQFGQQFGITIRLVKSASGYTGQFDYGDEQDGQDGRYPLTARVDASANRSAQLRGEYRYQGRQVPFTILRQGDGDTVSSDGVNLPIIRVSEPPAARSNNGTISQSPTDGSTIQDPNGEYTCVIPAGWRASAENGGFILRHAGSPVTIIISSHAETSIDRAIAQAADINNPAENTQIRVQARKLNSNTAYAKFTGSARNQPVNLELVTVFSPAGGGVVVTVNYGNFSPNPDYLAIAQSIAASARFTPGRMSPLARQWTDRLRGRKLVFLQTDSYGSQRVDLNLYANGSFDYQSNTGMVSQGGVGTGTYGGLKRDSGTWKIALQGNTPVLQLAGSEGSSSYLIGEGASSQQLLLNNRRYFIQPIQ